MLLKIRFFLQKLHPKNTLFARIFIWFWTAVIVMVVCAFAVGRLMGSTWELSAPPLSKLERAEKFARAIENQLNQGRNLERSLRRTGGRGRWHLMVVDPIKKEMTLGFPRPMLNQAERFKTILDAQSPLLIRTNNMEFIGPIIVQADTQQQLLFVGQLLPREERPLFVIGSAFIVFIVLGTLACIAIAITIVRPIKRLGELSKQFANGQVQEPDQALLKRQDELGQLHNDFYQMASQLAQSVVQQKALMANVSHELRTPLTRMQLALAMLESKDENAANYAKRIEKEIGVMDGLIGQALQLAKLDNQKQNSLSQKERTSLTSILPNVLEDLAFEAKASDLAFIYPDCPNVVLPLHGRSFVSAIENVTRNAIKYSSHKVELSITIKALHQRSYVVINIEDDGEGLSKEQRSHIFEPFYRVASNKQRQGTGLGLAIVKAAVELHDGEIKVYESSLGGLNISLSFPIETT